MSRLDVTTGRRVVTVASEVTRPNDVTAYAAGDALSDTTGAAHLSFGAATRPEMLSGRIIGARMVVGAVDTIAAMDVHLFHTDIATKADNLAWAPTDTELKTSVGTVSFAAANFKAGDATAGAGGNQIAFLSDLNIPIALTSANTLFGQIVVRGAYTPIASTPYQVQLIVECD